MIRRSWWTSSLPLGLILTLSINCMIFSGCCASASPNLVKPPMMPDLTSDQIAQAEKCCPELLQAYLDFGIEVNRAWGQVQSGNE